MLIVDADTVLEGELTVLGAVRVDGLFRGRIYCTSLEIGVDGVIEGSIMTERLIVGGQIVGSAKARVVHLHATAIVEGELHQEKLSMDGDAALFGDSRRLKAFDMPAAYLGLVERERQIDAEIDRIETEARVRKADEAAAVDAAFDHLRTKFPSPPPLPRR